MTPEEYAAQVAAFIRRKGITRCPTACVLPTQGRISAADRALLAKHWLAQERRRESGGGSVGEQAAE
jgi:hypothetical protein